MHARFHGFFFVDFQTLEHPSVFVKSKSAGSPVSPTWGWGIGYICSIDLAQ